MFFHSTKSSPKETALSSSNSKDIIKDDHTNLTLHLLVENPSSFAGSSIRFEKDSSIVSQEIKAKPGSRQTSNFTNNFTKQKDTNNKDRPKHSANKISKERQQQQQQQQQQSNTS